MPSCAHAQYDPGGRGQGPGRQNYQSRRVESHREKLGEQNSEKYDKMIKEKLLAGLKDEAEGISTKEAALLETACPLQISKRQIGFGISKFFNASSATTKAETLCNAGKGTPYQYYQVSLGLAEAKLYKTSIRVTEPVDDIEDLEEFKHDPEFLNITSTAIIFPEPISTFINSIGIYKDTTDLYFATMPQDYEIRERFVPWPENVKFEKRSYSIGKRKHTRSRAGVFRKSLSYTWSNLGRSPSDKRRRNHAS